MPFYIYHYSNELQNAIQNSELCGPATKCSSAELNGHLYRKGNVVAVRQKAYQQNVEMGKIIMILSDNKQCLFLVLEMLKTTFHLRSRLYELGKFVRYECFPINTLLESESFDAYIQDTVSYVKTQHGLVTSPL